MKNVVNMTLKVSLRCAHYWLDGQADEAAISACPELKVSQNTQLAFVFQNVLHVDTGWAFPISAD